MDKTSYTYIVFNRTDLFRVTKLGFMATTIGSLWCEGHIPTDRVSQLNTLGISYRTV